MKNTTSLIYTLILLSFSPIGCTDEKICGCTSLDAFNYNKTAETDDGSCLKMQGCVGYTSGFTNSGYTTNTLGDYYWDKKMGEEIYIQSTFFNGISANVSILVEPSPDQKNAYASSDGRILFGYHMFYYTIQKYGELPIAGILAHEWGHRVQQSLGWKNYTRVMQMELEADAFSGFYMALCKQYAWNAIESYYQNVYATGDYNYNHPSHHGTGDQRIKSAYLGVQVGLDALKNGKQYSYLELHNLFMSEINANIGQYKIESFPEVVYPKNLSQNYIKGLFPRM